MSKTLTKDVKKRAKDLGADLVGVASIERFEGAPKKFHPLTLLPKAKSIVSVAVRIPHGVLIPQKALVENYQYQIFGYGFLSHIRLNWIIFELARFLEDKGFLSLPFPSFCESQGDSYAGETGARPFSWQYSEEGVQKGASISNRHAAVVAGLGELSISNLFLSPQFGAKQRLATLITTAELSQDPLFSGKICDECMICEKVCPPGAIDGNESVKYEIAGRKIEVAKLNKQKCSWYHMGFSTKTFGNVELAEPETITWDYMTKMRKVIDDNSPLQTARTHSTFTPGGYCAMCLISCPKGEFNPK